VQFNSLSTLAHVTESAVGSRTDPNAGSFPVHKFLHVNVISKIDCGKINITVS
jgi:hypothetical protein